jgi:hypothetical protein
MPDTHWKEALLSVVRGRDAADALRLAVMPAVAVWWRQDLDNRGATNVSEAFDTALDWLPGFLRDKFRANMGPDWMDGGGRIQQVCHTCILWNMCHQPWSPSSCRRSCRLPQDLLSMLVTHAACCCLAAQQETGVVAA